MERPRLNETPLPVLTKIYCITLAIGLFSGLSDLISTFDASILFTGTTVNWFSCVDLSIYIATLITGTWILIDILNRKWRFLYVLYAFICIRIFYMLFTSFTLGTNLGYQSLGSILVPVAWAIYFNKSVKLRLAFPIRGGVSALPASESSEIWDEAHNEQGDTADDSVLSEASEVAQADQEQPQIENAQACITSTFEPEQQKAVKKLFCKNCGTECGPNDTKCPNCGKRVRFVRKAINKKPLLIVTFCILFLSVIGLSITCTMLYQQNVESQSTITSLDELSQNLQRTIDRKNDKIKELEKDYSDLFSDFLDYGAKADFLDNYIAFVVSDDAYAYHTYDCHFFQNCDSYWAYNIEAAQSRGYSPCKVCH